MDVELDQTGTLYLGFTEDDEHKMRRRFDWQTRAGLRIQWLSGEDAKRLEPKFRRRCAARFAFLMIGR